MWAWAKCATEKLGNAFVIFTLKIISGQYRAKPTVNVWFGVSWQKPLENTLYVEFKEPSPQYGRGSFFSASGMLAINSTVRKKKRMLELKVEMDFF